jgi:hypothetical protein
MIITPVLLDVRRQANGQVSLFSGIDFNVDEDKELVGDCDYILNPTTVLWCVTLR